MTDSLKIKQTAYENFVDGFNFDAPSAYRMLTKKKPWVLESLQHAVNNLPDTVQAGIAEEGIHFSAGDLTLVLEVSRSQPGNNVIIEAKVYDHVDEVMESWGLHKLNYAPEGPDAYTPRHCWTAWEGFTYQIKQWVADLDRRRYQPLING